MQVQSVATWRHNIKSSECQKAKFRDAIAILGEQTDEAAINSPIANEQRMQNKIEEGDIELSCNNPQKLQ